MLLGLMAILMPQGYLVIALHGMIQLIGNGTRAFVFKDAIHSFGAWFFTILAISIVPLTSSRASWNLSLAVIPEVTPVIIPST